MGQEQHWDAFLKELSGKDLWTAQHYATNPVGDGRKACIPTLKVPDESGRSRAIIMNEEKSLAFSWIFFLTRPTSDLIPPNPEYPSRVDYFFKPIMAQLHRCVTRLCPYKAPGEDDIPNAVIKELMEVIAEYLLEIYWAIFSLSTYSDHWRVWDTIVLRKPGKPRSDIPKAYQPIALMNALGKLLSALVAEDLTHMCDYYGLLPDNHFGGSPADAQPTQCIY